MRRTAVFQRTKASRSKRLAGASVGVRRRREPARRWGTARAPRGLERWPRRRARPPRRGGVCRGTHAAGAGRGSAVGGFAPPVQGEGERRAGALSQRGFGAHGVAVEGDHAFAVQVAQRALEEARRRRELQESRALVEEGVAGAGAVVAVEHRGEGALGDGLAVLGWLVVKEGEGGAGPRRGACTTAGRWCRSRAVGRRAVATGARGIAVLATTRRASKTLTTTPNWSSKACCRRTTFAASVTCAVTRHRRLKSWRAGASGRGRRATRKTP